MLTLGDSLNLEIFEKKELDFKKIKEISFGKFERNDLENLICTLKCSNDHVFLNFRELSAIWRFEIKDLIQSEKFNMNDFDSKMVSEEKFNGQDWLGHNNFSSEFCYSVSDDGKYMIGLNNKNLIRYNWEDHTKTELFNNIKENIRSIYVDFNQNLLITGYDKGKVIIRNVFTDTIYFYKQFENFNHSIISITLCDHLLLLGTDNYKIITFNLNSLGLESLLCFTSKRKYIVKFETICQNNQNFLFIISSKFYM